MGNATDFKNMAQTIDSIRTTDPSGPPVAQKAIKERVPLAPGPEVFVEGGTGSGNVNTGNTGNTSNATDADSVGSGVTPSLAGASDVVSDFDYYKNKLDQDGTAALIKNKYESQVKQTATESARYVAENISKGNQSYEQSSYIAEQTADKFGWSGGYALDAARQVEYLRASIQADIFSQQELQKLGYKSNLEAAYASAELELNEQAQNNYYQAQEMAISQAQLTGKYIDPAIADMCIQASAAQDIMKSKDPSSPEYQKAEKVYNYMTANLKARGNVDEDENVQITPIAIQTLAGIQMELEKLTFQDAQIKALNSMEESGAIVFPVMGDNGQIISWTTSPDAAFNENLAEFYRSKPDALETKVNLLMNNMLTGYNTWLQVTDASGKLVNYGKSINDFITTAYKNHGTLTNLLNLVQPKGKDSYTMGDLTVTKGADGKWTINVTGENTGGSGDTGNGGNTGDGENTGDTGNTGNGGNAGNSGKNITFKDSSGTVQAFEIMQFGEEFNLTVNTKGKDLSNYTGNMVNNENMSLKLEGVDKPYRVQVGGQVIYGTDLDKALNSISQEANSIAYIGGQIFVRDKDAWYVVERRDNTYIEQWAEFQSRLEEHFGKSSPEFAEFIKSSISNANFGQGARIFHEQGKES